MKSNTIYWLGLKFIFSGQIDKLKSVSARFVYIDLLPLRSVGYVVGTVAYITDQRVFQKQNVMLYISEHCKQFTAFGFGFVFGCFGVVNGS